MAAIAVNALAGVLRAGAAAWHPQPKPATPDWCEKNLWLPPETSADPGPINLVGRPYWREPLAMLDDPDVQTITLMGPGQIGKTILIQAGLISRAVLDPAPAMLAGPDEDSMRELRDKVYGMAAASPSVAPRVPPRRIWNDRAIDLQSMLAYLAFSGSSQRLRGRTCKYVFCTEVDIWRDSPRLGRSARLIRARTKAFAEFKIVYESTPTDEASTIDALNRAGDQRKFNVPCPHCGHHQELRFFVHKVGAFAGRGGIGGLQDEACRWLSPDEARTTAHYICEQGCRIESHEKGGMIARGVWCPKGCTVNKKGQLEAKPERGRRHVSYQINSLYAEHETFGSMAAAYLEHREEGALREFWNNWLGLPFRNAGAMPHWKTLGRRLSAPFYRRGTVPAGAWFLTAAVDVQSDRIYFVVRAWGDRASSWLVNWGMRRRDPSAIEPSATSPGLVASDLAQIDEAVLDAVYPVVGGPNPRAQAEMRVRVTGIDAGHRITDVHAFLRAHPGDRVRAIHGDHKVDPTLLYRMNVVEKNARTGKPYEGGLQLWGIAVSAYKRDLVDQFAREPDAPGSWRLPSDVLDAGGEDYLRQIVNESPVLETLPNGRQVVRWVVRDQRLGQHYWDDEVYNRCLADMVVGGEWDASKWARGSSQRKSPARPEMEDFFSALARSLLGKRDEDMPKPKRKAALGIDPPAKATEEKKPVQGTVKQTNVPVADGEQISPNGPLTIMCPYCDLRCKANRSEPLFTRYYCPTPTCGYSQKVARPEARKRLDRARRVEEAQEGFSAR